MSLQAVGCVEDKPRRSGCASSAGFLQLFKAIAGDDGKGIAALGKFMVQRQLVGDVLRAARKYGFHCISRSGIERETKYSEAFEQISRRAQTIRKREMVPLS